MSRHARRRQVVRWNAAPAAGKGIGPVLLGAGAGTAAVAAGGGGQAATPGRSDARGDSGRSDPSGGFGGLGDGDSGGFQPAPA